jgi:ABC-type transport system involved in cytochrome bd biosynthesis fused ATPase/permease subunit
MGRRWPPTPQDLAEAASLCQELGLGALLEQMPAGLQQMVGETGWQLSHGERSRVFIARTLLQGAELILLDESFAALDPTNLQHALACVLRRAPTLLADRTPVNPVQLVLADKAHLWYIFRLSDLGMHG